MQRKIEDFSLYEIQFFAYFSCLLSLYEGNSVEDWRYSFVKTELGSPYSIDIDLSIQTLLGSGKLSKTDNTKEYFTINEAGNEFFSFLNEAASSLSNRKKYLTTACDILSLTPLGAIKEAIGKEPVLYSAKNSISKKSLLEVSSPATKVLYSQFQNLKVALENKYENLLIPAMVWIEYLVKSKTEYVNDSQ
ncbi:MAG: hypothetical protein ACM3U1_04355 [Chloroflexota bacterium]